MNARFRPSAIRGPGRLSDSRARIALLVLAAGTGIFNLFSFSWTPFFRLNLFLHPLLGTLFAAVLVEGLYRRLRENAPGLTFSVAFSFVVAVFLAFFRSFTFLSLPAEKSNVLAAIFSGIIFVLGGYGTVRAASLVRRAAERRKLARDFALFLIATITAASGASFLLAGGGRSLASLLLFHAALGFLSIPAALLDLRSAGARAGGREVRAALLAGLLLAAGAVLVNLAGRAIAPVPGPFSATIHLSTIPYEKRPPEERDPLPFPVPVRWLAVTTSCGRTADCHPDLVEDFRHSIHNVSYQTPHFQKNLALLAEEIGEHNQNTCSGCHTPLALFEGGGKAADYRGKDNSSCVFCHAISAVAQDNDPRKSSLTVELPTRHLAPFVDAEARGGELDRLTRLSIRLNPAGHGRVFRRGLYKEDRYCQACHHLQLRASSRGIRCVICHMEPRNTLIWEGKAKNHFFPGANTIIPSVLGFREYADLNERWAQGEFFVRMMEDLYNTSDPPVFPSEDALLRRSFFLSMWAELEPAPMRGARTELRVFTKNTAVDHAFPASALDLAEVWLEVRVTDERGRAVFSNGGLDDAQRLLAGSHTLGGFMIGHDGQIVTRNRVWQIKEKVVQRQIVDQEVAVDSFSFDVPEDCGDYLDVTAQWRYRKLNYDFWTWAYGMSRPIPSLVNVRTFRQFAVQDHRAEQVPR